MKRRFIQLAALSSLAFLATSCVGQYDKEPADFTSVAENEDLNSDSSSQYEEQKPCEVADKLFALENLESAYDDFSGISSLRHRGSPEVIFEEGIFPEILIPPNNDDANLVIRFQHVGISWLFIEKISLKIDNEVTVLDDLYSDFKRDASGGDIYEWLVWPVDMNTKSETELFTSLSEANSIDIRFHGENFVQDSSLIPAERHAFWQALRAFEVIEASGYEKAISQSFKSQIESNCEESQSPADRQNLENQKAICLESAREASDLAIEDPETGFSIYFDTLQACPSIEDWYEAYDQYPHPTYDWDVGSTTLGIFCSYFEDFEDEVSDVCRSYFTAEW